MRKEGRNLEGSKEGREEEEEEEEEVPPQLSTTQMKLLCDVCEVAVATAFCCADEAALCESCDGRIHAANKLAGRHQRIPLMPDHPDHEPAPSCDICQVCVVCMIAHCYNNNVPH